MSLRIALCLVSGTALVILGWAHLNDASRQATKPADPTRQAHPPTRTRRRGLDPQGVSEASPTSRVEEPDPPSPLAMDEVAALVKDLTGRDSAAQERAQVALRLAGSRAIPAIVELARTGTSEGRVLALLAWELVAPAGTEHVDVLRRALEDPKCRDVSVRVMERMGKDAAAAVPDLAELIGGEVNSWSLSQALVAIGESAVDPVRERMRDHDRAVRRAAASILGRLDAGRGVPEIVETLALGISDEDVVVRRHCLNAMRSVSVRTPAVRAAIEKACLDSDESIRTDAAKALEDRRQ